ncbi:MAG TPA: CPBP family intramembrane glutamic endopeptidase, partial [Actinomycetota bacterium]
TAACASAFVLSTLFGELAFLVAVVFWVRVVDRAPLRALGLPRTPLRDLGAGIAGGAGLVVVGYIGGIIVFTVAGLILGHQPTQPNQVPTYVQHGTLVWSGVVVVLAAPLGEETLFRGFLYRGLRRRFSVWPAALISAALFALVHVSPVLVLALFPVGIGLALIFEWRQSLLASMAAHATFNLVGIIFIALSRR